MAKELRAPKETRLGLGNRVRAQVLARGRVIAERDWQPNLILDAGMDNLATKFSIDLVKYCAVGTGNTPTFDDSGVFTVTTSGTTATASSAFFDAGDVGMLLRCDTGEKAMITGFTSSTVVTLSAAIGVSAQLFTIYRVSQTALAAEIARSNTYVTSSGACFSSRSGSTLTSQRTFDFPAFAIASTASSSTDLITTVNHGLVANDALVLAGGTAPAGLVLGTTYYARDIVGNTFAVAATPGGAALDLTTNGSGFSVQLPRNFSEVGFSDLVTPGANLNMRALFAGGAVTVLAGQQIRIIYQFQITLAPTTPRAKTFAITGWPSLQQTVAVANATNLFTLATHGFTANMPVSFDGTTAPNPLVFGTTYYARDILTNTFAVSATPGGSAIDLTTDGTNVKVLTHTEGDEQCESVGLKQVLSTGLMANYNDDGAPNEPAEGMFGYVSTDGTMRGFPLYAQGISVGVTPGGFDNCGKAGTLDAYTGGTFTRTKRVAFTVSEAVSATIRCMGVTGALFGVGRPFDGGLRCVFDQKQDKNNTSTLTLVFRWTWDRVFS